MLNHTIDTNRINISQNTFQVADHRFIIESTNGFLSEKELKPYAPFQTDFSSNNSNRLFTLQLIAKPESISDSDSNTLHLEDENGSMDISNSTVGAITILLATPDKHECARMIITPDFHNAKVWIGGSPEQRRYALDSALMLMYTFASAPLQTLLLHASAIEYESQGYTFLGKSGTGKSTHSRLWLENIPGTTLLNDDNPIVRIIDNEIYLYGSPWSGKTPCYINHRIPLGGIVRLHQAPENSITPLSGIKAYAALLPSCSCMRWNPDMGTAIHSTIAKVIEKIPVFSLGCRPDREAAILCHEKIQSR